jgi:hypothetical protein
METNFCIGVVEQTTKGLRADEDLKKKLNEESNKILFPIQCCPVN